MNWTIAYNGTEKLVGNWGLEKLQRRVISQKMGDLSFEATGTLADSQKLFTTFDKILTLWRDRTQNQDGSFSGGTTWFQGILIQVPRAGAPNSESMRYKVADPWWFLENRVFQQAYENIILGFAVAGDPTTAIFGPGTSSHVFLNQGPSDVAVEKINNGQQIIEALNWAIKPYIDAAQTPPFQIGTITPTVDIPISEVRDITCAEVIEKMMRWSPDAVAWFDHTTVPPTFNCKRRADMTVIDLDISQGNLIRDLNVNGRYDLESPFVRVLYETNNTFNGASQIGLTQDIFPSPPPSGPINQYAALEFTVSLQGFVSNSSSQSAKLTVDPIGINDPNWWLLKHPQFRPVDPTNPADTENSIASFTLQPNTWLRAANPPINAGGNAVADAGYPNELTTGELASWMTFKGQRITITVVADVVTRKGSKQTHKLSYQCLATNATTGTFTNPGGGTSVFAEPIPIGVAQFLYNAISVLQFDGSLTLEEPEVSGSLFIGQLFNVTGSANAEWNTMAAQVHEITEDIDTGRTIVTFGPNKYLSAGDLVDLLRVNRQRQLISSLGLRISGGWS